MSREDGLETYAGDFFKVLGSLPKIPPEVKEEFEKSLTSENEMEKEAAEIIKAGLALKEKFCVLGLRGVEYCVEMLKQGKI